MVGVFLLQASVWWLLFPRGFWMVVVISWRLLNGCCYRLEASEQLLLSPGGCSMVFEILYQKRHFFLRQNYAIHCRTAKTIHK